MYLEDADEVIKLRGQRQVAMQLRSALLTGSLGDLTAYLNGNKLNVFSIVSVTRVKETLSDECERIITEKNKALGALGVNTAVKFVKKSELSAPKSPGGSDA